MTDKNNIEKCFSKSSKTYDGKAHIQKQIAIKLAYLLKQHGFNGFNRMLEIGCGTGFLTEQILKGLTINEYFINDLVDNAFKDINKLTLNYPLGNCEFIKGDAETLSLPTELNAVISTSTFQWFNCLEAFILKIKHLLNPNGILAFSTFGTNNYNEIKTTLNVGLQYKTLKELKQILAPNFNIIHSEEWIEEKTFNTPLEILKHMKLTGVNGLKANFLGKERLKKFNADYTKLFSNNNNSVSLTYNPIILIAKLK